MQTEVMQAEDIVTQKTQELCQAILDQPNLHSARQRISAFIADDRARGQYEALMTKGQALQQKQQQSQPLTGDEISDFEKQREALSSNPVAHIDGAAQANLGKQPANGE